MYQDDSQKRFVVLYLNSQHSIRQLLRLLIRDHCQLDDACQSVALRLWELFDAYDPSRPFDAWARGVAAKVALEFQRADRRSGPTLRPECVTALLDAFDRSPFRTIQQSKQLEALEACLESLPSPTRELLVKRYHQALPVEEVAAQTNRTVKATYKAIERTIRSLGDCVRRRVAGVASMAASVEAGRS